MYPNPGLIFIDYREKRSDVPKFLTELKVEFEFSDLSTDYQVGRYCWVERKTVSDFISSIADGRLFRQVSYLANNFAKTLLLLEGGGLYKTSCVPANIIRGTVIWVTVKKVLP